MLHSVERETKVRGSSSTQQQHRPPLKAVEVAGGPSLSFLLTHHVDSIIAAPIHCLFTSPFSRAAVVPPLPRWLEIPPQRRAQRPFYPVPRTSSFPLIQPPAESQCPP